MTPAREVTTPARKALAPDLSRWRALFDAALAAANGNKTLVAEQLHVSRTLVSLVAADKYHGSINAFAKRVIAAYDGFTCPHLGERVTPNDCRTYALRPAPTSSARDARHWRACQSCPHNPVKEIDK